MPPIKKDGVCGAVFSVCLSLVLSATETLRGVLTLPADLILTRSNKQSLMGVVRAKMFNRSRILHKKEHLVQIHILGASLLERLNGLWTLQDSDMIMSSLRVSNREMVVLDLNALHILRHLIDAEDHEIALGSHTSKSLHFNLLI